MSYCIKLAGKMHLFETPAEMAHLIRHTYTTLDFDEAKVKELAGLIADPTNSMCFVTAQSFDVANLPLKEKWYNLDYSMEPYGDELLNKMKNPVVADNGKKLDLPPLNTFLPQNFDILPEDKTLSEKPVKIIEEGLENVDMWYKKDDTYKKPKGIFACKIYTSDLYFGQTPKARVFGLMWQDCLDSLMQEFKYMAEMAAMNFNLVLSRDNVDMQWSGFSDTLGVFVQKSLEVIQSMRDAEFRDVFEQVKARKL